MRTRAHLNPIKGLFNVVKEMISKEVQQQQKYNNRIQTRAESNKIEECVFLHSCSRNEKKKKEGK